MLNSGSLPSCFEFDKDFTTMCARGLPSERDTSENTAAKEAAFAEVEKSKQQAANAAETLRKHKETAELEKKKSQSELHEITAAVDAANHAALTQAVTGMTAKIIANAAEEAAKKKKEEAAKEQQATVRPHRISSETNAERANAKVETTSKKRAVPDIEGSAAAPKETHDGSVAASSTVDWPPAYFQVLDSKKTPLNASLSAEDVGPWPSNGHPDLYLYGFDHMQRKGWRKAKSSREKKDGESVVRIKEIEFAVKVYAKPGKGPARHGHSCF